MNKKNKLTPLHDWHVENDANMAVFGDYDMPLWYPAGVKEEHMAVINSAGLFDTSHMAVVTVAGNDARTLLQKCFSKDLERCLGLRRTCLTEGRSVYGLFLDERGHVLDDSIVSQVSDALYMVVVNAGMGGVVTAHLKGQAEQMQVDVSDLTDCVGKIDIQGPDSARFLGKLLKNEHGVFEKFPYFSFKGWFDESVDSAAPVLLKDMTPVLLSRTGYTGEFGFEIFVNPDRLLSLWEMLVEAGRENGLRPCGLAARDSLRAGAVLPLSHQDIGDWPFAENPWLFALAERGEDGKFSKVFLGSDALASYIPEQYTLPFAGYDPRKIAVSDSSCVTDENGERIGTILTCATDMAIGRIGNDIVSIASAVQGGKTESFIPRGLSCGFVMLDRKCKEGDSVLLTDGRRKIKVEIRNDVRPDRTARRSMREMVLTKEKLQ